jgi:hypothetical protein
MNLNTPSVIATLFVLFLQAAPQLRHVSPLTFRQRKAGYTKKPVTSKKKEVLMFWESMHAYFVTMVTQPQKSKAHPDFAGSSLPWRQVMLAVGDMHSFR